MRQDRNKPFDLDETLQWVAHLVPSQGPLREFIHHNTLHAFQEAPFATGVRNGAEHYGSRVYMTLKEYRAAFQRGRITPEALNLALETLAAKENWSESQRQEIGKLMNDPALDSVDKKSHGVLDRGFREKGWARAGIKIDRMMQPLLMRMISAYLDQGISIWQFPNSEYSFWSGICDLVNTTVLPLPPLTQKKIRKLFS
ncbi:MAG: Na-translocating system protein MpsB, partial [Bdellovibrionales bacterium]|nr:Na-translocating system protein MpsB [Bdellovibrionales bacterium]